jgi:hypothetical protein
VIGLKEEIVRGTNAHVDGDGLFAGRVEGGVRRVPTGDGRCVVQVDFMG